MKTTEKKRVMDISPEEAMKQVQKIFKERGSKALEIARKETVTERIESKEACEALTYFITEYWQDMARPTLLSLVCEAVGGDPELTTPIAVPMILISGALDIHDDIIDQSKQKDGRPTVYGRFGKDIALLVGDALLFKGFTLLTKSVNDEVLAEKMPAIMDIIKDTFFELGDAEAMELPLRRRMDTSPDEYLRIIRKKAADVEAHARIGAILGNGSEKEIEALSEYGRLLGMLIILRDDWIDMQVFKEALSRIKRECLPLPLLYTLQNSKIKPKVSAILRRSIITQKDVQTILELTYKSDGVKRFENVLKEIEREASLKLKSVKHMRRDLYLLLHAAVPPMPNWSSSNPTTF